MSATSKPMQSPIPFTNKQVVFRYSLSFVMGVLLCFSFAPFYAWAIAIAAPAAIFFFWSRFDAAKQGFFSGWLFGIGFYAAGASWIYQSISHFSNASVLASLGVTILFIAYLSLYYGILGFICKKWFDLHSNVIVLLAIPALWVLMEWLIGHVITGFPWLLIGYSQIHSPLHVFAPIVGVYGLSYITILMACILMILCRQGQTKAYWGTWALLAVIILLSVWAKHHQWTHTTKLKQSVTLVQANLEPTIKWQANTLPHIEQTYQHMSAKLWQDNNLVVWPESALPVLPSAITTWLAQIQQHINQNNSHLITGIITTDPQQHYFNTAMLLSPHQSPQYVIKRHLVPFGEYFPLRKELNFLYHAFQVPMSDLSPGPWQQPLLHYGEWSIAPFICYEIAYPDEVMRTMNNANLLLVISDDSWFGRSFASLQHLGITQMRALETGRYILFSNNAGPSAIITPDAKVIKTTMPNTANTVSGTVNAVSGTTPYMRWANWPILSLSIFALLIGITAGFVRKNK